MRVLTYALNQKLYLQPLLVLALPVNARRHAHHLMNPYTSSPNVQHQMQLCETSQHLLDL